MDILEANNNLEEFIRLYSEVIARDALELGSFSLQNSNNVNINHSSEISIDSFSLKSALDNETDLFLKSASITGNIEFSTFTIPTWAFSNHQHKIPLSVFNNDIDYISKTNFDYNIQNTSFIFDEALVNMIKRPSFEDILFDHGYQMKFLVSENNLNEFQTSNLRLIRNNLNIGSLAEQYISDVFVDKITVENFSIQSFSNDGFIYKKSNSELQLGLNNFMKALNSLSNDQSNIFTGKLLHDTFDELHNNYTSVLYSNNQFINSSIEDISSNNFVKKTNYLTDIIHGLDISSEPMLETLNIQNVAFQNSNYTEFSNLIIKNSMKSMSNAVFLDNKIYNLNSLSNIEHLGLVSTNDAVSLYLFSNTKYDYDNQLSHTSKLKKISFQDFEDEILNSNDNFYGYFTSNINQIQANLNLHEFAFSGNLEHLTGRPTFVSELQNDALYVKKYNNLSEYSINSFKQSLALENLGINTGMALRDSEDIGGSLGNPLGLLNYVFDSTNTKFDELYIDYDDDLLGLFLKKPDVISEAGYDFIIIRKNIYNDKYSYEYDKLHKNDEEYFNGLFKLQPNNFVRVKLNDVNDLLPSINRPNSKVTKTTVLGDNFVPTAQFSFEKFIELTSNILNQFEIPFDLYDGGYDSI